MWCSCRAFSAWMAANSSGSVCSTRILRSYMIGSPMNLCPLKQGLPRRTAERRRDKPRAARFPVVHKRQALVGFHVSGSTLCWMPRLSPVAYLASVADVTRAKVPGKWEAVCPRDVSTPRGSRTLSEPGEQGHFVTAGGRRCGRCGHRDDLCGSLGREVGWWRGGHGPATGDLAQPEMLGHHLGRIAAIVGKVACADIKAQPALHRTGARNALLQNLHAHTQIAHGVKGSKVPAKVLVLVVVHIGHHLHQPLSANGALCKWVEARLDGHDGKDQRRVDLGLCANFIGLGHQHAQRLRGDTVLLAEPAGYFN